MRNAFAVTLALAAAILIGCGGEAPEKPAAGTPENPLVAKQVDEGVAGRSNEAAAEPAEAPGYAALLERQQSGSSKSSSRFTPCNLVTRSQAQTIVGGKLEAPIEAPQGPTCIYQSDTGKTFVTLAVQSLDMDKLRKQVRGSQSVAVGDRDGVCGFHGSPVLYAPLQGGRVLSVAAPCAVAKRFAARALSRIEG